MNGAPSATLNGRLSAKSSRTDFDDDGPPE